MRLKYQAKPISRDPAGKKLKCHLRIKHSLFPPGLCSLLSLPISRLSPSMLSDFFLFFSFTPTLAHRLGDFHVLMRREESGVAQTTTEP